MRSKDATSLRKAAPGLEELREEQAPPEQKQEIRFYQEVLEVIQGHPEGIRLTQIGEEIGEKWQTLIAPVNQLVEEEKVRKEDRVYFPAE